MSTFVSVSVVVVVVAAVVVVAFIVMSGKKPVDTSSLALSDIDEEVVNVPVVTPVNVPVVTPVNVPTETPSHTTLSLAPSHSVPECTSNQYLSTTGRVCKALTQCTSNQYETSHPPQLQTVYVLR